MSKNRNSAALRLSHNEPASEWPKACYCQPSGASVIDATVRAMLKREGYLVQEDGDSLQRGAQQRQFQQQPNKPARRERRKAA